MRSDRWLLPEGVEEITPVQAWWIESKRAELLGLFRSWGYDLVMPPMLEYLESLLTGSGQDLALQTFTLTDQYTGRLMGVRADMTPQVARIDAHYLRSEGATRLCYAGPVFGPPAVLASRCSLEQNCLASPVLTLTVRSCV